MDFSSVDRYSLSEIDFLVHDQVDAIIVADSTANVYKTLVKKNFFKDFLDEHGSYEDLIKNLLFHFNHSNEKITSSYAVFLPSFGHFEGKYSRKLHLCYKGQSVVAQFTTFPVNDHIFIFLLDQLDNTETLDDILTDNKVSTIQNVYLFSMYIDLIKDATSSISITEMSDDTIKTQIKYSEWRLKIVNMIDREYQEMFLERSDPDYLKAHFRPGQSSSFDCLMLNLEGHYIWVKLIFSRAETSNADDYRFVFMVQNIHENMMSLMSTLKEYEDLASRDSLTHLFDHGRIETEIQNAIDSCQRKASTIALMMLDLDNFKQVNDKYGHSVGDTTLKHFASLMTEMTVDHNIVLGRWGGEEFVAVCYDMELDDAADLAEDFRQKVAETGFDTIGSITCSIGVTEIELRDTFKDAFDRVDNAMYDAKHDGRNLVKSV